jgi:hypothetical protein
MSDPSLSDWLNSINHVKLNIIDKDPNTQSKYVPYVVNRCLSAFLDTVLLANEMNMASNLTKKMQYDFLINSVRARKRFSPWLKDDKTKELKLVKEYYGFSDTKAKEALRILTKDQIKQIEIRMNRGGIK